jgi:hypothetical protein
MLVMLKALEDGQAGEEEAAQELEPPPVESSAMWQAENSFA